MTCPGSDTFPATLYKVAWGGHVLVMGRCPVCGIDQVARFDRVARHERREGN